MCALLQNFATMDKFNYIDNGTLEQAWTSRVQELHNIDNKSFYLLRKERGVQSKVKAGRPQKNSVSVRGRRLKAMRRKNDETADRRNSRKLSLIYPEVWADGTNAFLAKFMLTVALGREFLRIGIDPLQHDISWESNGFRVNLFKQMLAKANQG